MRQAKRQQHERSGRKLIVGLIGAMMLGVAGFIVFFALWRDPVSREHQHVASTTAAGGQRLPIARRETRPTLDPASFSGKAALAYQVAREIPDVLDHLQCYCACGREYGHLSLLSCYTDGHGST
jgi:hypothetical protein